MQIPATPRFHWYLMVFQISGGKGTAFVDMFMASANNFVTKPDIDKTSQDAVNSLSNVPQGTQLRALCFSTCYLGHMTHEEFFGTPVEKAPALTPEEGETP